MLDLLVAYKIYLYDELQDFKLNPLERFILVKCPDNINYREFYNYGVSN